MHLQILIGASILMAGDKRTNSFSISDCYTLSLDILDHLKLWSPETGSCSTFGFFLLWLLDEQGNSLPGANSLQVS
jgi:hypothetical protein